MSMFLRNKILYILLFLVTLSSCSTSLKVTSLNCPDNLELFALDRNHKDVLSFSVRKSGIGELNYSLKEIFEEQNLSCAKIRGVSFDITQSPLDVALSLIPSFSSRTLVIYYR